MEQTTTFDQVVRILCLTFLVETFLAADSTSVFRTVEAATCTSSSSPGGSFTDPTSTFVGCTITGFADFNFGSVVSTAVALSLSVSGSTVQAGKRLSIAGFAGLTAHQPLNATIVDSTFSNSALRITGTFPASTTITVLRTGFSLVDTKLSVGQVSGTLPEYISPNIFFVTVVFRDKSQFRLDRCTVSNTKSSGSLTYNTATIHSMTTTDLTLSNQSSLLFSETTLAAKSYGAFGSTSYHMYNLRFALQFEGTGNTVEFHRCNLSGYNSARHSSSYFTTALAPSALTANPPTATTVAPSTAADISAFTALPSFELPPLSSLLPPLVPAATTAATVLAAAGISATAAVVVSGCQITNYGGYNGFQTYFNLAPGTFAVFENNYFYGNRGTVNSGESQSLLGITRAQNISVLARGNTFDATTNLMRQAVAVSSVTWQSFNLILYQNRVLLNNDGLVLLGTPALPSGVTTTPIIVHLIENIVSGSAVARLLLQGYTAPHETLYVCRNFYYGNRLVSAMQYAVGTGVTDTPITALRYACGSETRLPMLTSSPTNSDDTTTISASKIAKISATNWLPTKVETAVKQRTVSKAPSASLSHDAIETRSGTAFFTKSAMPAATATVPFPEPLPSNNHSTRTMTRTHILVEQTQVAHATRTQSPTPPTPAALISASNVISASPSHTVSRKGVSPSLVGVPTHSTHHDTTSTPRAAVHSTRSQSVCPQLPPAPGSTIQALLAPTTEVAGSATATPFRVAFVLPSTIAEAAASAVEAQATIQWDFSAGIASQLVLSLDSPSTTAAAAASGHCTSTTTNAPSLLCSVSGVLVRAALRAVPDRTSTLRATIVADQTGPPCGRNNGGGNITLILIIQPPFRTSDASVTVTVFVVAATSAALLTAIVDPTAVDAQLITVVLLSSCSVLGGGEGAARISRYLLSPLIDLGPAVVALAHTGAALAATALHVLVLVFTQYRRRLSFAAACDLLRFPSVSFSISSVLYAGAAWGTAAVIRDLSSAEGTNTGTSPSGLQVAAVVCAVCLLLIPEPALCAFALMRTAARHHRFIAFDVLVSLEARRHVPPPMTTDVSTAATVEGAKAQLQGALASAHPSTYRHSLLTKLSWWCLPHGSWERFTLDRAPAVRSLRGLAGPRAPLLLVLTRLLFLVCAALVTAPPRSGACDGRLLAAAAILVAWAIAVSVTRPFRVHATTALSAALALSIASLAAAIAASHGGLTNAAIVLASVCAVLRGVHTAAVLVWEHRYQHQQQHCLQSQSEGVQGMDSADTALLEITLP